MTASSDTNTANEPHIRSATATDVIAATQIVANAYRRYISRMGRTPTTMLEDYAARIQEGSVWVIEQGHVVRGVAVLVAEQDHMLLENIAVEPAFHGIGLGRRLLIFAEAETIRRGYREIRLYTHKTMTENQELYARIGYVETGRSNEAGYDRVFMRKQLTGKKASV